MTRKFLCALGLAATLPLSLALVGPAVAAPSMAAADQAAPYALRFTFDNGETLSAGSRVIDSSGLGNNGTVRGVNGGRLRSVKGYSGRSAQFPTPCRESTCARAVISVPNGSGLNPGLADFSFGVAVRVTRSQVAKGYDSNLIQKGLWSSPSQWKLQLDGARAWPVCVFAGMRDGAFRRVSLMSGSGIADGEWHKLSCERTATTVRLVVDAKVTVRVSFRAVRLSDSSAVTIGGRAPVKSDNDQFFGTMDRVFVSRG
jgi:hypothetical protein